MSTVSLLQEFVLEERETLDGISYFIDFICSGDIKADYPYLAYVEEMKLGQNILWFYKMEEILVHMKINSHFTSVLMMVPLQDILSYCVTLTYLVCPSPASDLVLAQALTCLGRWVSCK